MEEEDFGDDDLDTIPDNALQQLEQTAFSSTQRQKVNVFSGQQRPKINTYGTAGLTRSGNAGKNIWRPPQPRKPTQTLVQDAPPASAPEPPSSDYGIDEEDIIDLDEPSTVISSTSALPTRARPEPQAGPGAQSPHRASRAPLDPETEAAFAAADAELGTHQLGLWVQAPHLQPKTNGDIDISSLQSRVAELEAEQVSLRQSEQDARDAAVAKLGEIAIVRANHDKATKEYDRRIAVMQKLHAEESAKQKAELEAGSKEREKMETNNRFLQHDLAHESERAKRLTGPGKARVAVGGNGMETPRKAKRTGFGDGFDDDEVHLVSPSKSKDKSREQTPKVGTKRKRPAQDSPIAPLSFSNPLREESGEQLQASFASDSGTTVIKDDGRYAFIQRVMNHLPYEGHGRTVEALAKYAFPSNTGKSLSSLLMDRLTFPLRYEEEDLPLKLSRIMLKLWSQCLDEAYYAPLYLLVDTVRFAIQFESSQTVTQLIDVAVSLCMRTINLVAVPNFLASTKPSDSDVKAEFHTMQSSIAPHIEVDEILDLLRQLCNAASLTAQHIEHFWQKVTFDFTMCMLNKAQPISQITSTLQMVSTSALSTTFGPICTNIGDTAQRQMTYEHHMIDRLTSLLFEMPEIPKDEPAYTDEEVIELRIEVLEVLKTLCLDDHGSLLLAQHKSAIGRLFRFLYFQLNKLYTARPAISLPSPGSTQQSAHQLLVRTINTIVRIVYHLLHTHDTNINLLQKIHFVKGGYHKFLVSMTRIAFSDKLVFEEGIDEEVAEAAHQILDSVLSPEEGEAIVRAVETPRGTKGTSTEENTQDANDEGMEEEPG